MKLYGISKFDKLFKGDIDCELFMRMVKIMITVVKKEIPGISPDDIKFVCSFFNGIVYF